MPTAARATDKAARKEAMARWLAGKEHADLGRFEAAISEFEAAYALSGDPAHLTGIGKAYQALGKRQQALDCYRRHLAVDPDTRHRSTIEGLIDELSR